MASRIRKHLEQQGKRTMYLSIGGSLLVILFLAIYGLPLLTKFALFLSKGKTITNVSGTNSVNYIAAPFLDNTYTATNSATVKISGSAAKGQNVKLYVDGSYIDEKTADDNGGFIFDNVQLTAGDNDIKAKAIDNNNKESDYSNILNITYINKGPNLTINTPSDNQTTTNNTIVVQGKTDTNATVTVNGFQAIVDDQGNFSYTLSLQNGDNNLSIIATDNAGNTTTVQKKVTYNH